MGVSASSLPQVFLQPRMRGLRNCRAQNNCGRSCFRRRGACYASGPTSGARRFWSLPGGKMSLIRWISALALVVAATACGPQRSQPMTAFEGRLSDWSREILSDSPELASQAGVTEEAAGGRYIDRLDDRSPIALEARRSAALRRYAELRALDVRG